MIRTDKYPVACHAPEITTEKVSEYETLISGITDREVKDRCADLLSCVKEYMTLPASAEDTGDTFVFGEGAARKSCKIHPFDQSKVNALWDVTPYMTDLAAYEVCFEALPPGTVENEDGTVTLEDATEKAIRDMAFHLLWYAKEITLDREPLTLGKLI